MNFIDSWCFIFCLTQEIGGRIRGKNKPEVSSIVPQIFPQIGLNGFEL